MPPAALTVAASTPISDRSKCECPAIHSSRWKSDRHSRSGCPLNFCRCSLSSAASAGESRSQKVRESTTQVDSINIAHYMNRERRLYQICVTDGRQNASVTRVSSMVVVWVCKKDFKALRGCQTVQSQCAITASAGRVLVGHRQPRTASAARMWRDAPCGTSRFSTGNEDFRGPS